MGAKHARLGLSDLSRAILSTTSIAIDVTQGPEATVELLAAGIRSMLEADGGDLLSVGICLPGPVDAVRRVVVAPSRMPGWHNQDVGALLEKALGVPAITDNDANLAALGEYLSRPDAAANSITVLAGTGVGTGIMVGGQLYRGSTYASGDITHTKVEAAADRMCSCGNRGCLETIASGAAIVRDLAKVGIEASDIFEVLDMVRDGDPTANGVVREAGRQLGLALSTVVNFFNPGDVYLAGALSGSQRLRGCRPLPALRTLPAAGHGRIARRGGARGKRGRTRRRRRTGHHPPAEPANPSGQVLRTSRLLNAGPRFQHPQDHVPLVCTRSPTLMSAAATRPRIGTGGMSIEASNFSPHRSGFEAFNFTKDDVLLSRYTVLAPEHENHDAAVADGATWVPLVHARSLPGGMVEPVVYETLKTELIEMIHAQGPFDGFFLDIHGAMTVVGRQDAEADLTRAVRAALDEVSAKAGAPRTLISATMDLHGNVSADLVENCDLITCYRMAPHEDEQETKTRAMANLITRLVDGHRRPGQGVRAHPGAAARRKDLHPAGTGQGHLRGDPADRGLRGHRRRLDLGRLRLGRRAALLRHRGRHRRRRRARLRQGHRAGHQLLGRPRRLRVRRARRRPGHLPGRGPGPRGQAPLRALGLGRQPDRRRLRGRHLDADPAHQRPALRRGRPAHRGGLGLRQGRRRGMLRRGPGLRPSRCPPARWSTTCTPARPCSRAPCCS